MKNGTITHESLTDYLESAWEGATYAKQKKGDIIITRTLPGGVSGIHYEVGTATFDAGHLNPEVRVLVASGRPSWADAQVIYAKHDGMYRHFVRDEDGDWRTIGDEWADLFVFNDELDTLTEVEVVLA